MQKPPNLMIPILMYHEVALQIYPHFRKYMVTPQAFAAQMKWLALAGYSPIDLDTLVGARLGRAVLPPKPIVITFDDGFQGNVDYAAPILHERGFTAVFYLVAGLMGKKSRWLRAERGIELPLMDWQAARQLCADGFQCGAHTMSHPRLAELNVDECRYELHHSRQLLEDQLGREIRHLAYPFGSYDGTTRTLAEEAGYTSAASVEIGLSSPDDDLLALRRVPVSGLDSLVDFATRLTCGRTPRELFQIGRCRIRSGRLAAWLRRKGIPVP
jgi:peptidoglycan/xylan/chitin deacetylase (PgdA/CDA1 family)